MFTFSVGHDEAPTREIEPESWLYRRVSAEPLFPWQYRHGEDVM